MKITIDQRNAIAFVSKHISTNPVVAIDGAAGTGKTTIIGDLIRTLKKQGYSITLTAYTNKAVQVLRAKGLRATDTFHRHCFKSEYSLTQQKLLTFLTKLEKEPFMEFPSDLQQVYGRSRLEALRRLPNYRRMCSSLLRPQTSNTYKPRPPKPGVLIVDEASMINKAELEAAKKVFNKIVLVGDSHQLAPVKGTEVFDTVKPVFTLTEVLRHPPQSKARDLANAIRRLDLANLRTSGKVSINNKFTHECVITGKTPVITFTNERRQEINTSVRAFVGYDGLPPQPNELLVCTESYSRFTLTKELHNGSFWKVLSTSSPYVCTLKNLQTDRILHDIPVNVNGESDALGYDFDYAYCLTAHTAQGSEFPAVIVDQAGWEYWQDRNRALKKTNKRKYLSWLYTAVTRARIEVYQLAA